MRACPNCCPHLLFTVYSLLEKPICLRHKLSLIYHKIWGVIVHLVPISSDFMISTGTKFSQRAVKISKYYCLFEYFIPLSFSFIMLFYVQLSFLWNIFQFWLVSLHLKTDSRVQTHSDADCSDCLECSQRSFL